jgi:hypothetical protein
MPRNRAGALSALIVAISGAGTIIIIIVAAVSARVVKTERSPHGNSTTLC